MLKMIKMLILEFFLTDCILFIQDIKRKRTFYVIFISIINSKQKALKALYRQFKKIIDCTFLPFTTFIDNKKEQIKKNMSKKSCHLNT